MLRRSFADRFQRHGTAAADVTVHGFAPWSVDSIQSFDESMRQSDGSAFLPSAFDTLLVSPSFRGASFQPPRRRPPICRRSLCDCSEVPDLCFSNRPFYCVKKLPVSPPFLGVPLLAPRIETLFAYPGERTCSLDIVPTCDVKDNEIVNLLCKLRRSPYISH